MHQTCSIFFKNYDEEVLKTISGKLKYLDVFFHIGNVGEDKFVCMTDMSTVNKYGIKIFFYDNNFDFYVKTPPYDEEVMDLNLYNFYVERQQKIIKILKENMYKLLKN